jgi:hypothetical protein
MTVPVEAHSKQAHWLHRYRSVAHTAGSFAFENDWQKHLSDHIDVQSRLPNQGAWKVIYDLMLGKHRALALFLYLVVC